jgi:hypothetical protein
MDNINIKKANFTLEQTMEAKGGNRGIALFFLTLTLDRGG